MTYYKNNDYKVIAGWLLYPMKKEFDESTCHSDNWFGDKKTNFIVDGIDLTKSDLIMDGIVCFENEFLDRIKTMLS